MKNSTIAAGIDQISLTIGKHLDLDAVLKELLGYGLDSFSCRKNNRKLKWYKRTSYLKTERDTVLVVVHSDPVGKYNNRNLIQIKGLALSDSALNALRPLTLDHILTVANKYHASVTDLHLYLDVFADLVPLEQIQYQSLPYHFHKYIRSPLMKQRKGVEIDPRICSNGVYYGQKKRSTCQVLTYNKRLAPRQGVYDPADPDNSLKFHWYRIELRLIGDTAKMQGKALLDFDLLTVGTQFSNPDQTPITLQQFIAWQISKYITFIEPTSTRPSRCPLQTWWSSLLDLAGVPAVEKYLSIKIRSETTP